MSSFPARFVNLPAARARFGDRVDRLGPFLRKGDPPADAVVEVLATMPREVGWRMVEAAASRGVATVPEAPAPMRAFFQELETVPAWVDFSTIDVGGRLVLRTGILSGLVLGAQSIVLGYASPGGNKPLVLTGNLLQRAGRRLNETARYVRNVVCPGGLRPFADGYVSSVKVRLMHAQVRRMLQQSPRWDEDAWGVAINQHDMAATTLLFSLVLVQGLEKLGVSLSAEERESYMHLWRWAGRLMGVDSDILPTCTPEAERLADVIAATQAPPDDDARELVRAFLQAGVAEAQTPQERTRAERGVHMLRAISHELLGRDLAAALGFAPSPLRLALPVIRRLVRSGELMKRARPFGDAQLRAGTRYWDEVRDRGYALYGTPFHLPEHLAA